MNVENLIQDIKTKLSGDPQKDGPFLKDQSEKYKDDENSQEINRELAKLLYESSYKNLSKTVQEQLKDQNPEVDKKLENVLKRYKNLNYNGGIKILEEIIDDNLLAWKDQEDITYKSFGTPLEHALYLQIYQPVKEVRHISCNLSEVYSLYGQGLAKKERYSEAIEAFIKAIQYNPTDAEIYINYAELLKTIVQPDELRLITERIMCCAVTKEQLGKGYFNYSFYFCEKNDFDKAAAMLEMSRIFLGDNKHIDDEYEYIANRMGKTPPEHTQQQLMDIMNAEQIQPGPPALVVATANFLAKHAKQELDYELALFYYETVWELTELDDVKEQIEELETILKKRS